ncbi:MAG TPA: DUF4198 domain-containing protein [Terriglobales bacterium]|jgi:uncharacterized GH25 family protein|nr:DUF4198 domain-containing protein [Terriglobales bacterium]
MRRRLALLLALILVGFAKAHDLYLVTGIAGAEGKVCARIGEKFPESTGAVTADRLDLFQLRAGDGATPLKGTKEEDQLCATLPANSSGVAEIVVHPRFIKLSAKDFNSYLEGEKFTVAYRLRRTTGKMNAEGRELYSRYGKLLMGALGEPATKPAGHILEIVPEKDPAGLKPGEPLRVRVLFRGKPLAGAHVGAVYAGAPLAGHDFPVLADTGQDGWAVLKLDRPGLWYARLIHMTQAQGDPEIDWRSYFATITFTVPK